MKMDILNIYSVAATKYYSWEYGITALKLWTKDLKWDKPDPTWITYITSINTVRKKSTGIAKTFS